MSMPIHTDDKPYYLKLLNKIIFLYIKMSMLRAPTYAAITFTWAFIVTHGMS